MTRWLPIGLAVAAAAITAGCGDDLHPIDRFTPTSGTRLALQSYRFDDGTEQVVASEFYDLELHTRCTAAQWRDGSLRCIPAVDEAQYVDAACTELIGFGRTIIARPSHFVAYDTRAGIAVPVRVLRAGGSHAVIAQYYTVVDGRCSGPVPVPGDLHDFFEIAGELDGDALAALTSTEIGDDLGDGRLALQIRTSDDGARVPLGLYDRALATACTPRAGSDGSVACEPIAAVAAAYFGDAGCTAPVVSVSAAPVPAIARLVEPSGCASYHSVGRAVAPPIYRRDGSGCTQVTAPAGGLLFAVDAALELPALARSLETVRDRRLSRILLDRAGLRWVDDRLFDRTTGSECERRNLRGTVRCLPANLVPALTLFDPSCTVPVRVAELPRPSCERIAYATSSRPFQIRAIGDPVSDPLFRFDGASCVPYAAAPGTELRALGPPIDLTTFMSAIYFGERPR
jgi:hypothetical protein